MFRIACIWAKIKKEEKMDMAPYSLSQKKSVSVPEMKSKVRI